jgi:CRISPR-associated protein Cst2
MTPQRLRDPQRAKNAIDAICSLRTVAGNHGRFLYDFAPEVVIFRVTTDPAPRLLYCFDTNDAGHSINADVLFQRIECGDIDGEELYVGVSDLNSQIAKSLAAKGAHVAGVKATAKSVINNVHSLIMTAKS